MHSLKYQQGIENMDREWTFPAQETAARINAALNVLNAWPGFDFDAWFRTLPRTTGEELAFFYESKIAELRAAERECTCTPRDAQACPACRAALSDSEIPY
jgi:hypothetical protein